MEDQNTVWPDARKPWEEPAVVLERSLEAAADETPPTGRRPARQRFGFLGPLGASGGVGGCL